MNNEKHNMKKKFLVLLSTLIIVVSIVGCNGRMVYSRNNIDDIHSKYFDAEIVENIGNENGVIVRDKNTDVLYLYINGDNSPVMTPIYDSDGTVKLYEEVNDSK